MLPLWDTVNSSFPTVEVPYIDVQMSDEQFRGRSCLKNDLNEKHVHTRAHMNI